MKKILFLVVSIALFSLAFGQKPKHSPSKKPKTVLVQKPRHALGAVLVPQAEFKNMAKFSRPNRPKTVKQLTGLSSWVVPAPPPGDQLTEGSCVAWAVGYTFFSSYLQRHQPNIVWDASTERSPGFVYHYIKLSEDCGSGSNIPRAITLIENIGACTMKAWPYVDNDCNSRPTYEQMAEGNTVRSPFGDKDATEDPPVQNDPHGRPHVDGVIVLWQALTPTDVEDYKAFLKQYNWPIMVAFNVNSSFDQMWDTNGIWTVNSGPVRGGHAVCVVGWDDNKAFNGKKGMFKCQNQWGTTGGDKGYFWVSYDLVAAGCFLEAYVWVRDETAHD